MSQERAQPVRRRFIAGASCPSCAALDRIQRCEQEGRIWMECVVCGFKRDLDEQVEAGHGRLPIVNQP